jgi:hypothetical protein
MILTKQYEDVLQANTSSMLVSFSISVAAIGKTLATNEYINTSKYVL